nr:immunoglobulin light chain junction region [Macaca mulatta]MOV73284.1 immunoglobulin light chain junction region [Macaca mulatta]MOV73597.1 immunoglobulin light chain junction region [Macaca mulatta]MOV73614.1 immunoglobulin light chain junction region [Macaca mulatta]MOV73726.1 immunoglobulin light chain junction region [Macaca mulatta]
DYYCSSTDSSGSYVF